jgi:hypothetical protein
LKTYDDQTDDLVRAALAMARATFADHIDESRTAGREPRREEVLAESALQAAILARVEGACRSADRFLGARVIVRAPALLAHLETLVDFLDEQEGPPSEEEIGQILTYLNVECRALLRQIRR